MIKSFIVSAAALAAGIQSTLAAPADSTLQLASSLADSQWEDTFVAEESRRLATKYGAEEQGLLAAFAAGTLAKRGERPQGLRKRQSGGGKVVEVELVCWHTLIDLGYTVTVDVGTPPQSFPVLPDTGSSDFWLNSPGSANFTESFDETRSTTYSPTGGILELQYNKGAFRGDLATDVVSIGGLSIPNKTFASGVTDRFNFGGVGLDGIMGFAFTSIASSRTRTFFDALVQSGQLATSSLGYFANRGVEAAGGRGSVRTVSSTPGGAMTFGGVSTQHFTGSITNYTLSREQHWTIPMDGFVIDGQLISGTAAPAAIDTGTSLIQISNALFTEIQSTFGRYAANRANQLWVACDQVPESWALRFGGKDYAIAIADLITDVFTPAQFGSPASLGNVCGLAISGGQQAAEVDPTTGARDQPLAVVGSAFLKNWYSVYTMGDGTTESTVGFAQAVPQSSITKQNVLDLRLGVTNSYPSSGGSNVTNPGSGNNGGGSGNSGGGSGNSSSAGKTQFSFAVGAGAAVMAVASLFV